MGWCSGTDLFDDSLDALFSIPCKATEKLVAAVEKMIKAFESHDADCLMDGKHVNNAIFIQAWLNTHPNDGWYYDAPSRQLMYNDEHEG